MTSSTTRIAPARLWIAARIVILAAATIALIAAARSVDWSRASEALRHANVGWLAVAVLANAAILLCWAAFWTAVRPPPEPRIPYSRMLEIVSAASALMNTLPFGGGHASSMVLLVRRGGLSQRGALSMMALDQLGEGLVKVALFVLVGLVVPPAGWMRAGLSTFAIIVGVLFLAVFVASRWAAELSIVKDLARGPRALGLVVAMKGAQLVGVVAVQIAYDVHVGATGSLFVLASVVFASMVPVVPGNLGAYEAAGFLAYRYLGVAPELALSMAVMQHVCFLIPSVGVGYVVLSAQTLAKRATASR